jgi:hypothetical protein
MARKIDDHYKGSFGYIPVLETGYAFKKSSTPTPLSKKLRPQGGALKPYSKTKNEIPKQVRDDKKERNQVYTSPFIPVHRTGFSGVSLIMSLIITRDRSFVNLSLRDPKS